jgi:hypothetical protein
VPIATEDTVKTKSKIATNKPVEFLCLIDGSTVSARRPALTDSLTLRVADRDSSGGLAAFAVAAN